VAPSPLDVVARGNTARQRATGTRASRRNQDEALW
jgi:hypothetical protein